jgi:hypothetical protein
VSECTPVLEFAIVGEKGGGECAVHERMFRKLYIKPHIEAVDLMMGQENGAHLLAMAVCLSRTSIGGCQYVAEVAAVKQN